MNKGKILVSVIIPAFNAEKYVGRAIRSVLNQSVIPTQIIVVDDGSTDDTSQISLGYDDIISIAQTNKGASSARNYGISKATGNYIAFLDADDEWLPDKLALQIELMNKEGSDICLCDLTDHFENGREIYRAKPVVSGLGSRDIIQLIFDSKVTRNTPTLIFRANIIDKIGGFNEDMVLREDHDFLARLVSHGKISSINKSLVNRYVYSNSLSNSINIEKYMVGSLFFYKSMLSSFPFLKYRKAYAIFCWRVLRLSIKRIVGY